jgi:hypothetical protein
MNTVWRFIIRIALAALSALPVERIVAALLNAVMQRLDEGNVEKARKSAEHLSELAELFSDVLADRTVTEFEVCAMRSAVMDARERLLANWAAGQSGRHIQAGLAEAGLTAAYARPATEEQDENQTEDGE